MCFLNVKISEKRERVRIPAYQNIYRGTYRLPSSLVIFPFIYTTSAAKRAGVQVQVAVSQN